MKAEDLPIYIEFTLEGIGQEDITDFPGDWDNEANDFFEIAPDLVYRHLLQACKNMLPLFQNRNIRSMSVGIDVLGFEAGSASYYHHESDSEEGFYGFVVSPDILADYLRAHWDPSFTLIDSVKYVWEHELIHMFDHDQLIAFKYHVDSTDTREFLIHWLLNYRNEGLATLYELFASQGPVRDMATARKEFSGELERVEKLEWENPENRKQLEKELLDTYRYYTLGPWMILHVLNVLHPEEISLEPHVLARCAPGRDPERLLSYIRKGLTISNREFIRCLSQPVPEGKPFIEADRLESIAGRILKAEMDREGAGEEHDRDIENRKLVDFFRSLWPDGK